MMVKSGIEKNILKFYEPLVVAAQFKKICPEMLNWPCRLACIYEGARGISKKNFLDHFLPFWSQKMLFQELRFFKSYDFSPIMLAVLGGVVSNNLLVSAWILRNIS